MIQISENCKNCKYFKKMVGELMVMNMFKTNKEFKCDDCIKSFDTLEGLMLHKTKSHALKLTRNCKHIELTQESGYKQCLNCRKIFLP